MEDNTRSIKDISLLVTDAKDISTTVKELQQVTTLSIVAATGAVKNRTPIPFWKANPRQYWVPPPLPRVMAVLDRLSAAGATVEVMLDGTPFDRQGMVEKLAQAEAEELATKYKITDDHGLFRIANQHGAFRPIEVAQARKELARRLSNVDAKELLWTASSSHSSPLHRELAHDELKRRSIDISNLRDATGACPHPRWKPTSDRYHTCACCFSEEKHDGKVAADSRGFGHGCSKCGYLEQN